MSLPDHLTPIEPAEKVHDLCDRILGLDLPYVVRLEAQVFRETRTPHDARRLANALRHVVSHPDLADEVLGLIPGGADVAP